MRTALVGLAVLAWAGCGSSEAPPSPEVTTDAAAVDAPIDAAALAERRAKAGEHYQKQEYAAFVTLLAEVVAADPDAHVDRYNLACGYALTGQGDKAVAELRTLLAAGQDYGAALDPDFASVRDTAEFQAYLAEAASRVPAISTSTEVLRVADWKLQPEGIAWDPRGRRYFLSSMSTGRVVAVTPDGTLTPFGQVEADVPLGTLGLAVDADHGRLWAVGTSFLQVEGFQASHAGTTGVFAFDLATGAQTQAVVNPDRDPKGGFNDLALGRDGRIYATGFGALTRIDPAASTVERVVLDPPIAFANGIAFGAEPTVVYLGTLDGIARVDLTTGKHAPIGLPEGENADRFDGLYYTDGRLVGIQLGGRWRAVELTLDPSGTRAVAVRTLEQGNPALSGATTGAVVGSEFHYLARARPTGAALEAIPEAERGLAALPIVLKAPLAVDAIAGE